MILATFLGTKPTSGYGVHIESALDGGQGLRAEVWTRPSRRGAVDVVTQPYSMVVVPRQEARCAGQDRCTEGQVRDRVAQRGQSRWLPCCRLTLRRKKVREPCLSLCVHSGGFS